MSKAKRSKIANYLSIGNIQFLEEASKHLNRDMSHVLDMILESCFDHPGVIPNIIQIQLHAVKAETPLQSEATKQKTLTYRQDLMVKLERIVPIMSKTMYINLAILAFRVTPDLKTQLFTRNLN